MEWVRADKMQKAVANGYEVEITERDGWYNAVCYRVHHSGIRIMVKKFHRCKALGYLKLTIENDKIFTDKQVGYHEGERELAYWQK